MVNHRVRAGLAHTYGFVLNGVGQDGGVGGVGGAGGFSDQAGSEAIAVIAHDVPDGELETRAGDGIGWKVVVEEPGDAFEIGCIGEIEDRVVGAGGDVDEEVGAEENARIAIDTDIDASRPGGFIAAVLAQVDVFPRLLSVPTTMIVLASAGPIASRKSSKNLRKNIKLQDKSRGRRV